MRFTGFLLLTCLCTAEVIAPLIGYVCDRDGALRPVTGLAAAFVTGEALEHDVIVAAWSGKAGFAKKSNELLLLDANGVARREAAPEGSATFGFLASGDPAWVRFADGSCRKFAAGCPVAPEPVTPSHMRLPDGASQVDRLGDGWFVARTAEKLFAIRVRGESEETYELPEAHK